MKNRVCKILICIITFLIIAAFSLNTYAKTSRKIDYNFNFITEEDSIKLVTHYNITIPGRLLSMKNEGSITKNIIKTVYNNPNYVFAYNYDAMQEYADSIKQVLLDNYLLNIENAQDRYSLQYSKVKDSSGNWVTTGGYYDSSWTNYNCYAYSIHRYETSPFYATDFPYQPGDMADDESGPYAINTFNDCNTITDLAGLIEKDLIAMGYSNVIISDAVLSVNSSQELICVRMGNEDYHFMHYDQTTDSWYHKPSRTAVLKYNYVPSNDYTWNNEHSCNGVEYPADTYYNSDVKFIRYDKNRVSVSSSTSNLTYNLGIYAGKDSMLEIHNTSNNKYYAFSINSVSSVNVELFDNKMSLIQSFSGSNISFYRKLSSDTYYLKVNYLNTNSYGSVVISILAHAHDYCDHYLWNNNIQHTAVCVCGNNRLEPHAVSANSFSNGQQYATCLLCGGLASIGFVGPMSQGAYPTTVNGSFILPNGIVVLVDDDIYSYINGTLVFSYPNVDSHTVKEKSRMYSNNNGYYLLIVY